MAPIFNVQKTVFLLGVVNVAYICKAGTSQSIVYGMVVPPSAACTVDTMLGCCVFGWCYD